MAPERVSLSAKHCCHPPSTCEGAPNLTHVLTRARRMARPHKSARKRALCYLLKEPYSTPGLTRARRMAVPSTRPHICVIWFRVQGVGCRV